MEQQSPEEPLDLSVALDFTPAPSATNRHDGWSEQQQRRFVAALAATASVAAAAKAIGMGTSSAYALRRRAGAESFAAAWDAALDEARDRAFERVLQRALRGRMTVSFYRGRYTGARQGYDHQATMAALARVPIGPSARADARQQQDAEPAEPQEVDNLEQ